MYFSNIKLATYASRCIENEILMFLRKSSQYRNDLSIDEPLNIDYDGNELLLSDVLGTDDDVVNKGIETEAEREILREAVSGLCDREREIMEMRFGLINGKELTQKEVADRIGISQSYISRLEKKIKNTGPVRMTDPVIFSYLSPISVSLSVSESYRSM